MLGKAGLLNTLPALVIPFTVSALHLPLSPELQDYPPRSFGRSAGGWRQRIYHSLDDRGPLALPTVAAFGIFQLWFTGTTFSGHCSSFTTWKKPRPLLASPSSHPMKAATTSADDGFRNPDSAAFDSCVLDREKAVYRRYHNDRHKRLMAGPTCLGAGNVLLALVFLDRGDHVRPRKETRRHSSIMLIARIPLPHEHKVATVRGRRADVQRGSSAHDHGRENVDHRFRGFQEILVQDRS